MSSLPDWRVMPSLLIRGVNLCGLLGDSCPPCWLEESNLCCLVGRNTMMKEEDQIDPNQNRCGNLLRRIESTGRNDSSSWSRAHFAIWFEELCRCFLIGELPSLLIGRVQPLLSDRNTLIVLVLWSEEPRLCYSVICGVKLFLSDQVWSRGPCPQLSGWQMHHVEGRVR